jgi:hypothetical protein
MQETGDNGSASQVQHTLRQLFNSAAAMSLAVFERLDAEPEMAQFLEAVKAHPEQRAFVVKLFLDSFTDSFHMKCSPTDLLMYCMSDLRWEEIYEFVRGMRDDDIKAHGVPCYNIWLAILESFQDDWRTKYFRDFTKKSGSCAGPVSEKASALPETS